MFEKSSSMNENLMNLIVDFPIFDEKLCNPRLYPNFYTPGKALHEMAEVI